MKLIFAIIQPPKLKPVQEALEKIGVQRMTVADAMGYGRQRGQTVLYRGNEYKTNFLRKVCLEIAVNDDFIEPAINAISGLARTGPTGQIGDGKVLVLPVEEVIDIAEGQRGPSAV